MLTTTGHSRSRIKERSRTAIEDVRSILGAKAFVPLGTLGHVSYQLFYSPFDEDVRVALVDESESGESALITVLFADLNLPRDIRVHPTDIRRAKKLYHSFAFSHCVDKKEREVFVGIPYRAQLSVRDGRRVIYTDEHTRLIGKVSKKDAIRIFMDRFRQIEPLIEQYGHLAESSIFYLIEVVDLRRDPPKCVQDVLLSRTSVQSRIRSSQC